jgi:hypothetical protein
LSQKKLLIVLSGKGDIESYFRVTVYLPFLDTMLEQLNLRFTEKTKAAALFDALCPKAALSISADDAEADFLTLWKIYSPALHANNVEPLDTVGIKSLSEFKQWCSKWSRVSTDLRPDALLDTLKQCDNNVFPTLHALLTIGVVIPVSTATPERTFSALRLLKTYLRNRTGEKRLNGLAHMYFNSTVPVDIENVIDRSASMKNRRNIL